VEIQGTCDAAFEPVKEVVRREFPRAARGWRSGRCQHLSKRMVVDLGRLARQGTQSPEFDEPRDGRWRDGSAMVGRGIDRTCRVELNLLL